MDEPKEPPPEPEPEPDGPVEVTNPCPQCGELPPCDCPPPVWPPI